MKIEEKRLVLDIPKDLHNQIKQIAAHHGVSIKSWVSRAIMNEILKGSFISKEKNGNMG